MFKKMDFGPHPPLPGARKCIRSGPIDLKFKICLFKPSPGYFCAHIGIPAPASALKKCVNNKFQKMDLFFDMV